MKQSNNYCIYMHINKFNNKKYIGFTSQSLNHRCNNGKGYKKCPLFFYAIQKYGWNNFEHKILYMGLNREEAKQKERELIEIFKTNNPKYGYNIENGTGSMCQNTKNKISTLKKGKTSTFKGKKHTQKSKKIIYEKAKPYMKPIYQFDKFGNLIAEYESIKQAERITGFNNSCICMVCKKKRNSIYGYTFRYKEEYKP